MTQAMAPCAVRVSDIASAIASTVRMLTSGSSIKVHIHAISKRSMAKV